MKESPEVLVFMIVVGMLLCAMFLGLGIYLGREYERLVKRKLSDDNNIDILCNDTNNDSNSSMGNIYREIND